MFQFVYPLIFYKQLFNSGHFAHPIFPHPKQKKILQSIQSFDLLIFVHHDTEQKVNYTHAEKFSINAPPI